MKAIGNISVSWRKGKGSRRILIGVIRSNNTEGIRFSYLADGVEEAKKFGFTNYDGFPDLNKVYTDNVIEIFGQRIMRSERHDVDDFFKFWKIDKAFKDDNFYMLAYTQGMLPTDNFEFLADFNPLEDLSFISEISGLTNAKLSSDIISVGDKLTYKLEKDNSFDSHAVAVFKGDKELGYIKTVHCKVFSRSKTKLSIIVHHIEKNGNLNRVFVHISK